MKRCLTILILVPLVFFGCSSEEAGSGKAGQEQASASLPDGVLLAKKPGGAQPLADVKGSAKKGDEVKFNARVGGRKKPFVDGRAVMVVIDPSLPSCADNEGDSCPIPWDYCCETQEILAANTATVQFLDDAGKPLTLSLKGQMGLKELDWITIVGKVENRDDAGLFVVNATGLFIEKKG